MAILVVGVLVTRRYCHLTYTGCTQLPFLCCSIGFDNTWVPSVSPNSRLHHRLLAVINHLPPFTRVSSLSRFLHPQWFPGHSPHFAREPAGLQGVNSVAPFPALPRSPAMVMLPCIYHLRTARQDPAKSTSGVWTGPFVFFPRVCSPLRDAVDGLLARAVSISRDGDFAIHQLSMVPRPESTGFQRGT